MPKFNMYQSLHTTVIGPQGKPVEVQIRTFAQHRRAEYGVAAHWKYKENTKAGVDTDRLGDKDDLTWLRQLLDWQSEVEDPGEFLESLRFEMNQQQVYVFTPRGDVIPLPIGRDPGRLRLRRAHRGRPPHDRLAGQRPARAAGVDARQRRRRRGLHLQVADVGPVARLAQLRPVAARPLQDPPVVHQGAPRGGDRARQGPDRQAHAQGGPAPHPADDPRRAGARRRALPPRRRLRALRRGRRGQPQRAGRRTTRHRPARRRRRSPGGPRPRASPSPAARGPPPSAARPTPA